MKHHLNAIIPGAVLVAVGLFLLIVNPFSDGMFADTIHWSLFIIIPGALLMAVGLLIRDGARAVTTLGAVVLMTGLVLAYQSWAGHFQSWAYAWILVGPVATGLAWLAAGIAHDDARSRHEARPLILFGLLAFVAAAAFFELVVGISGHGLVSKLSWSVVISLCLILAGGAMIVGRLRSSPSAPSKDRDDR